MIGILFIYLIGKYFYKLADEYNQNKWLFAIISIVMYYVGTAIGGLVIGMLSFLFGFDVDWDNTLLMSVIAIPFGLSTCWLFYYLLKKNWESKAQIEIESIDDIGKNSDSLL